MSKLETQVTDALEGSPGKVVAYMCGQRFRNYQPAAREALADVFSRNGWQKSAESLTEPKGDALRALQAAVSRRAQGYCTRLGQRLSNGTAVTFKIDVLESDSKDVKAWGIYRIDRRKGERGADWHYGARVYASSDGTIAATDPVESSAEPACVELAERIARDAAELLDHADTVDVSNALVKMYQDADCYPFIARGIYLAAAGRDATERLVACIKQLRSDFYSEADRSGIRAAAIRVTESDSNSVSDAVIDDVERRCAELADALRDYSHRPGEKAPRESTLQKRSQEAADLLAHIEAQRALMGDWAQRFEEQVKSLRGAYNEGIKGFALQLPDWAESPDSSPVAAPAPVAEQSSSEPEPASESPAPAPEAPAEATSGSGVFDF